MSLIKIKSAAKVREEEQIIAKAQEACAKKPRTTDRTDYDKARAGFRAACLEIREYLNKIYPDLCEAQPKLKTFRGAFDEVMIIMEFLTNVDDQWLIKRLLRTSQIDTAMEYEATALCIDQPKSWYSCWEDELGPYGTDGLPADYHADETSN